MRRVMAGFRFELTKSGVLESMKCSKPEPGTGESVIIGRRHYRVKQVGQVITRRTAVTSARRILSRLQQASAMFGTPVSV